jgi:two-component system cell cycle sensor histidine kinase/response regulator CckA
MTVLLWVVAFVSLFAAGAMLVVARRRGEALAVSRSERREAGERARQLFESNPIASYVFEMSTLKFLEVNDAALKQYGYTRAEFLNMRLPDLRLSEDLDAMNAALSVTEDIHDSNVRHRRKDQSIVQVEVHSHQMKYDGVDARLVLAEDITARVQGELALRRSEAQFRAMSDASPAGIVLAGAIGRLDYANQAALDMMGLTMNESFDRGWVRSMHPDDRMRVLGGWEKAALAGQSFTTTGRFLRPDGQIVWWRVSSSPVRDGGTIIGHVGVLIDETEQQAAVTAMKESEERFRQLAENIPGVVYLVEPKSWKILFISRAYDAIWGRSHATLYDNSRAFLDALHPDDRERVIEAYQNRKDRLAIEYRIIRPNGEVAWIDDLQFPIRRPDGSIYLLAGLAFDVSQRHQLETQVVQSQKMESLGLLAGGVAHDFNNLLTVILSYADLLKESTDDPATLTAGLTEIETAGKRASALTRQLLTFARRQILEPRVFALNDLIIGMERMLRHLLGARVTLVVDPGARLSSIKADPHQIEQVVMNLVLNARDAMEDGGTLTIATMNPTPGRVQIAVADTGHGIPADVLPRVFEPFFTTKPKGKGTGLGLSTSYGIVTQGGGEMKVSSTPGVGTTITCEMPVAPEALAEAEVADPARASAGDGSEVVLLAEDEPGVREVAKRTLERRGYRVLTAANGVEGLSVAASNGHIDLLVTDVVMPEMGGRELATTLKRLRPEMKVLFTSGYNEELAQSDGELETGVEFLPKPYLPGVLSQRVRQVLDAQ